MNQFRTHNLLLCLLMFFPPGALADAKNSNTDAQPADSDEPWQNQYSLGYSYDWGTNKYVADQISFGMKWRPEMKLTLTRSTSKSDTSGGTTVTPGISLNYDINDTYSTRVSWSNAQGPDSSKTVSFGLGGSVYANHWWDGDLNTIIDLDWTNQQYSVNSVTSLSGVSEAFASNTMSAKLSQELVRDFSVNIYVSRTTYNTKDSTLTGSRRGLLGGRAQGGPAGQQANRGPAGSGAIPDLGATVDSYPETSSSIGFSWTIVKVVYLSASTGTTKYVGSDEKSRDSSVNLDWDVTEEWTISTGFSRVAQSGTNTDSTSAGLTFKF